LYTPGAGTVEWEWAGEVGWGRGDDFLFFWFRDFGSIEGTQRRNRSCSLLFVILCGNNQIVCNFEVEHVLVLVGVPVGKELGRPW